MKAFYNIKNTPDAIVDVDFSKRTVMGYFARFGNVDSDGDMIKGGAFAKTINESGIRGSNRIKHLKNHDPSQMIGKLTRLEEDGTGLYFESVLSTNSHGKDALIEYQEGLLTEHSIGYQVMQSDQTNPEYQVLSELKLWEGSAVTWGANELTPVVGIKSKEVSTDDLIKRLDRLYKACKIGQLSDDYLSSVEIEIKQIQQILTEKLESKPSAEDTSTSDSVISIADYLKSKIEN